MPKIFLSHCSEDKPLIDTIAQNLLDHFDKKEIFYDAWSMQPGENFLRGMEEGLKDCDYFFLFMSEVSIHKPMVRLEWHSALLSNLKGATHFIPVRVDNITPPALLTSTLYIDMYNRGLPQTVEDIVLIANGESTYSPTAIPKFQNLGVEFSKTDDTVEIKVFAKRLAEPDNHIGIWTSDGSEPTMFQGSWMGNTVTLEDDRRVHTFEQSHTITPHRPNRFFVTPEKFPVDIEVFQVLGSSFVSISKANIA